MSFTANDFQNPDVGLPEDPAWKPARMEARYALKYLFKRPDLKPKPAFPGKGEKDLWISTENQFVREAFVNGPEGTEFKEFGVVVGLFSDGTVEVKPMDEMVLGCRVARNMLYAAFPEETGLPPKPLPFAVLSNRMHQDNVHRGKA